MTEEEKRFKILKKESYEKSAKNEENKLVLDSIETALMGALAVLQFTGMYGDSFVNTILGAGAVAASLLGVSSTIQSVCKKTMYEGKIEDINAELEMLEQNEKGGMRR